MAKGDKLTAARSSNRDASEARPIPRQSCSDIVNISVFFDGTGNNKDVDESLMRWSNPARMWRAAQALVNDDVPNYAIYISGVGTPFNETATDWMDQKMMRLQDEVLGLGTGAGGTRRMDYGEARVNARLRVVLSQSAAKLNLSLPSYTTKGKPSNIKDLAKALERHGLITIINLSIFGFSRGAALARAFSNEMLKKTSRGLDGILRYNGVPIRFNFMGLFDTVASFGVAAKNVDMPFDEKDLVVSPIIERCVHYVAAHELRFSFPVDLIRKDGKLMPNWTETVYPGAHSVGGGYDPICQGISNNYARIPMRDMMLEAVKSGVRLLDYDDIAKHSKGLFTERFEIKSETLVAYKKYMSAIGSHETAEQAVTAHMKALYSVWGTMTRRKIKTPDLVEAEGRSGAGKILGHPGIAREAAVFLVTERLDQTVRNKAPLDLSPRAMNVESRTMNGFLVLPAKWRLDAWQATASEPVLHFIQHHVHDSKAGFLHSCEPFSYFTARGTAESSRNVLARGLDWMDDAVTAIKNGVIKVYHCAEGVVVETWEDGKLMATRTYQVGEKFVVDTVHAGVKYTVEVYQSGKQVLISTVKRGEQMVIMSIDMAKKQASAAAEATKKKASEVGSEIYDGAAEISRSVGQAVDTGMQAVEGGWHAVRSTIGI